MPYKGYIKSEEYKQRQKEYRQTDTYYKYTHQRSLAKDRGIEWKFTFEDWCEVWQDSGHWEERGSVGYHMCRYGDEGPYSKDNVYIAHHLVNKKHQHENGHRSLPPIKRKVSIEQLNKIKEQLKDYTRGLAKKLCDEYGLSIRYIYFLKRQVKNECL